MRRGSKTCQAHKAGRELSNLGLARPAHHRRGRAAAAGHSKGNSFSPKMTMGNFSQVVKVILFGGFPNGQPM